MSLDIQYISIDHSQFQGSKNSKLKTAARISLPRAPLTKAALPSLLLPPTVVGSTKATFYSRHPLNGGLARYRRPRPPTDLAPGGSPGKAAGNGAITIVRDESLSEIFALVAWRGNLVLDGCF